MEHRVRGEIVRVGVDLAKRVVQVHAVDKACRAERQRVEQVRRDRPAKKPFPPISDDGPGLESALPLGEDQDIACVEASVRGGLACIDASPFPPIFR